MTLASVQPCAAPVCRLPLLPGLHQLPCQPTPLLLHAIAYRGSVSATPAPTGGGGAAAKKKGGQGVAATFFDPEVPAVLPDAQLAAAEAAYPDLLRLLRQLLAQQPVWPAAALAEAAGAAAAAAGVAPPTQRALDDVLPRLCYKFRNGVWVCMCVWKSLFAGDAQPLLPLHALPVLWSCCVRPTRAPAWRADEGEQVQWKRIHPVPAPPAGPWKHAWTWRGYDPRPDPVAARWQCVEYHLPSEW